VAASPGRAGALRTEARTLDWAAVAAVLALGALVRALRFWGVISWAHWDEANVAIPAIQILGGTFPVQHVGVEYVGATGAYPMAAWFALAGVSTVALDVFGYAIGLGVLWTSFLIARRVLPPRGALLALSVLAAPPLLLAYWSLGGTLNPTLTLLLGNLVLLGTHTAFFRRPGEMAPMLAVGLLVGLGWWVYPLIVVYCLPFAILALRTGAAWRAHFWVFPLGVALGGLPDWIYETLNYPTARLMVHQSGSVPVESLGARAAHLFGPIALAVQGVSGMDGFVPPRAAQAAVLALGLLVILRAAVRDWRALVWLAGLGGRPDQGLSALWGVAAANVGLVLLTHRPLGANYLLPLYSVLPIWTGECLQWLWGWRRWLGMSVLAGLLAFHLWSNWMVTLGRKPPALRWTRLEAVQRPLIDWLVARDIRRVYWAPDSTFAPYEFTYLAGTRVIAADLWAEAVIQHAHAVDAADAPPIVTSARRLASLGGTLRGLGLDFRETPVGGSVVLEVVPPPPRGFAPLPSAGWTLSASHRGHELHHLIDRDAGTGWSTGERQAPGQWLRVDLGRPEEVARVDLLAIDWMEVPAGIQVETSEDGEHWKTAVAVPHYWGPLFWSERHAFLKVRRGRIQLVFEPVRARFLRLTQMGTGQHAWAARELFVYRPAPPAPAGLEPGALGAALRQEGVRFVYANHWLSARARVESDESIGALESNAAVNSYGRSEPEPSTLERFRMRHDRALLLGSDADAAAVEEVLAERGAVARERAIGSYRLFLLAPERPERGVARSGWGARASVAPDAVRWAIDGEPRTRWMAPGPVDGTTTFTLDLGQLRPLAGLRLTPGSREGGPADFGLEGSVDGQSWRALEPRRWAGPLYWTGAELLRNSRPEWAVRFPPTTLRYVRVRPAAPAPTWSIAEITAVE
jgi:hypothetical protein